MKTRTSTNRDPAAAAADTAANDSASDDDDSAEREAQAKAKTDNKRVLVVFGGNWCTWCHKLQMLFDRDEVIAKKLADNYELVHIDSHSNEALIKEMGVELKGVPFLAVTDGEGKILVQQETGSLEEGPRHDPGKIGAFLDQWAAS